MADAPACCPGMAHYAWNQPGPSRGRFTDPECLIHVSQDGTVGIIMHDGSGRYSIIKFCPWCGGAVGPEAGEHREAALRRAGRLDEAPPHAQGQGRGAIPRGTGPKRGGNRKKWDAAARQAASDRSKALHAARKAAALVVAPGEDEEPEER